MLFSPLLLSLSLTCSSAQHNQSMESALAQLKEALRTRLPSEGLSPRSPEQWALFVSHLKRQNSMLQFLESSVSDVISICDSAGNYLYVSPTVQHMLGYQVDLSVLFLFFRLTVSLSGDGFTVSADC